MEFNIVGPSHRQSLKDVVSQAQSVATFSNNSHQSGATGKKKSSVVAAVTAMPTNSNNRADTEPPPPTFETIQTGTKPKQQKSVTLETGSGSSGANARDSPKMSSSLPPLKKKSVTVKETVPPPVPPRGSPRPSGSKSSQQNIRASYEAKTQNLSTGKHFLLLLLSRFLSAFLWTTF